MMNKNKFRLGIGGIRVIAAAAVLAAVVILRFCGTDMSAVGSRIPSGGSAMGVAEYVIAKYNEFTA